MFSDLYMSLMSALVPFEKCGYVLYIRRTFTVFHEIYYRRWQFCTCLTSIWDFTNGKIPFPFRQMANGTLTHITFLRIAIQGIIHSSLGNVDLCNIIAIIISMRIEIHSSVIFQNSISKCIKWIYSLKIIAEKKSQQQTQAFRIKCMK